MCTPTRGQLLTGLDALRSGATSVTAGRSFLKPGLPTMPEMFAKAGYKTGIFGKWHLGDHYPHRPIDRGFQESVYHLGWGMLHAAPEFDNPLIDGRYFHNGEPKQFTGHCTDFWFDSAMKWMTRAQGEGRAVPVLPADQRRRTRRTSSWTSSSSRTRARRCRPGSSA